MNKTLCFVIFSATSSVFGLVSAGNAWCSPKTNGAAINYLAQVMDQFHGSYDVYSDAGAAGNHFIVSARMSNQDNARKHWEAGETVPPMQDIEDDTSPGHPHHPGLTCLKASFRSQEVKSGFNWGGWYFMNGVQGRDDSPESWLLQAGDLREPTLLALVLRLAKDPLSHYLNEQLSFPTLIKSWDGSTPLPPELHGALVDELNRLMRGTSLYKTEHFASVALTANTRHLMASEPQGKDLMLLNRLLLEEAYPEEIARHDDNSASRANWGSYANAGVDLRGATELQFWARGEKGGERVEFFAMGIGWDTDKMRWKPRSGEKTLQKDPATQPPLLDRRTGAPLFYPGTGEPVLDPNKGQAFAHPDLEPKVTTGYVTLSRAWKKYTIDLRGKDLNYVLGGFGWATSATQNGLRDITFYLDDIRYNKSSLDEPRFLVSYETKNSSDDFDKVMRNGAHTYDNAVALLAFLAAGDITHARRIADAFVEAQRNDRINLTNEDPPTRRIYEGSLRNAYQGGDLFLPPGWTPNSKKTVRMSGWHVQHSDDNHSDGKHSDDPAVFRMGDVKDTKALVEKLKNSEKDPKNELTQFLWRRFSPEAQQALTNDICLSPKGKTHQQILIDELNRLLQTDFKEVCIYDEQRFAQARRIDSEQRGVAESEWPSSTLRKLVREDLRGEDLIRLNRLLLQAAYPDEMAPRLPEQWLEDQYSVSLNTGNMAWVMIALLAYQEMAAEPGKHDYLDAAIAIGEWVERNCGDKPPGYSAGFEGWEPAPKRQTYKSTEHNIDLYAAFKRLALITKDTKWDDRADNARRFVLQMWDGQKFWTGTTPDWASINQDVIPTDIQAWAILSLRDCAGEFRPGLSYVENHMKLADDGYDYSQKIVHDNPPGYQKPEGVWYEGTAQMATAYHYLGGHKEISRWQALLAFLKKAQTPSGGITASDQEQGLATGFRGPDGECNFYFKRTHVGATAWLALAERAVNPFWLGRKNEDFVTSSMTCTPK